MTTWLLEQSALQPIQSATARGVAPTAEQLNEFNAIFGDEDFPGSRIMSKAGSSAEINITGTLTKTPSWMAYYFGGGNTAYSELISAINEAERDPNVKEVTFNIDSPGGMTNGLTTAMDAIKNMSKPNKAIVKGQASSAAYGLASQADTIIAEDRGSMVGSVGVAASYWAYPENVDIASTNAPKKRPDVTTEAGKDVVRETLDQIEAVFIKDIAEGRGVDVEAVKANFGQGGIFLADNALKNGMIDGIQDKTPVKSTGVTFTQEATAMDLKQLKATHPETYEAAVSEGKKLERDRVSAHLKMGETSGDMATAIKACNNGDEMTQSLQAEYMAATVKKIQLEARAADDTSTAGAANNANQPVTGAEDAFDKALEAQLNKGA